MPKENYTTLNETFAKYFREDLEKIGSFYFTKEAFDGTYPGYGSSYPDLQGGLGLLFEQASSRGHKQKKATGDITFAFTIRNQYASSLATIRASVENKDLLYGYQQDFFQSALSNANRSGIRGYVFGDAKDPNKTKAFLDKLLIHKVKVYELNRRVVRNGKTFEPQSAFIVPTAQPQYRIIQSAFETYREYTDSVFYDASAWSLANFYHMDYESLNSLDGQGNEVINLEELVKINLPAKNSYAYLIPWEDYNAMPLLQALLEREIVVLSAFKPFAITTDQGIKNFDYGTLLVPVSQQKSGTDELYIQLTELLEKHDVQAYAADGGYSTSGIDLGSRYFRPIQKPKPILLIGEGTRAYDAGEVWHLLDTRIGMPITKVRLNNFEDIRWKNYNTLVLVSGSYASLDSLDRMKIKQWVSQGNTIIAQRTGAKWLIEKGIVEEKLVKKPDGQKKEGGKTGERLRYVDAPQHRGKKGVGGAIFEIDLDLTHPVAFGYSKRNVPVYRNSDVWIAPSKNPYATVAAYAANPHIDGFISEENLNQFLKKSASIVVSKIGEGRAVLFAENTNFRSSWYGTNKLFMNTLFLGNHIQVPRE